MSDKDIFKNLPNCAVDYIKLIIKKMRYRKKIRTDVQAELIGHFEDALKDCKTDDEKEKLAKEIINDFGDAKMLAVLSRRAKKRCRPLWKKAIIHTTQAIGIIVLYIAICAGYLTTGSPTVSVNYVEWLNDKVRADRDESLNSAPLILKTADTVVQMPEWLGNSRTQWPGDFNEPELSKLEDWLGQNSQTFELLTKALDKPYYWNTYNANEPDFMKGKMFDDIMKPLSKYRKLAYAMVWQVRYYAYKNDTENAVNGAIGLCSLGHRMQGNGTLVEQLVGIAIEALGYLAVSDVLDKTNLSTEQLEKLQNFFQQGRNETIIDISTEKACVYDFIQRTFTDDGKGGGRPMQKGIGFAGNNAKEVIFNILTFNLPDKKEVIKTIDEFYENSQQKFCKTPPQLEQAGDNSEISLPLMLNILAPSFEKMVELSWRLRTHMDATITTIAILRYHKQTGKYPESLDKLLEMGYIDKIPFDAYRNGALTYKKTENDFILYSFGKDFDDDGGKASNWGKKPDGGDMVFWPVTH